MADEESVRISYETVSRHLSMHTIPCYSPVVSEVLGWPCALAASGSGDGDIDAPASSAARWLEATRALKKTVARASAKLRPSGPSAPAHLIAATPVERSRLREEVVTAFSAFRDDTHDLAEHIRQEKARKAEHIRRERARKAHEAERAAAEQQRRFEERWSAALAEVVTDPVWQYSVQFPLRSRYSHVERSLTIWLRAEPWRRCPAESQWRPLTIGEVEAMRCRELDRFPATVVEFVDSTSTFLERIDPGRQAWTAWRTLLQQATQRNPDAVREPPPELMAMYSRELAATWASRPAGHPRFPAIGPTDYGSSYSGSPL
jgi:hypothetical protein